MQCKRSWTIAIAVLILFAAATEFVLAQADSRAASQTVAEDAGDTFTFRVRIQNISADSAPPTLFAPGVWVLHSESSPLFTSGEADRDEGLEALAEDGDPTALAAALLAKGLSAGIFSTPVCADSTRPLQSREFYEFEVTASPETPYLSYATMLVQSNDLFLAPVENGIALFDEDGKAIGAQNVTGKLLLWDAGTEANEEPGVGPNQAPRQSDPNVGSADEIATVRPVDDEYEYPDIADLVRVYIVPVPMVERDRERQPALSPHHSLGENFQVGDVQWQVLSAENLDHEIKNEEGDRQTTDGRFIQVRFHLFNEGSEPLEFDGGPIRNRKGVPIRDSQGREYTYYLEPRTARPDGPPHDYVAKAENCYGNWTWRGWRPFVLKPNTPTTCSIIYEVSVDATDFVLIASDLGHSQEFTTKTADLNLPSVLRLSIPDYVRVGNVRWQVLDAENLGHVLEENGERQKTKERFVTVLFQLTNKGSETLKYDVVDDVKLRDNQGREHRHYLVPRVGLPDRYPGEFIPDSEECNDIDLDPNKITTCTAVYEVPADATGLIFIASDLGGVQDGAEIVDLALSDLMPVRINLIEEDVGVGDMCWHVLSVEELGKELTNEEGDTATTQGRFIQVQFRILNLGSRTLEYGGVSLLDSRGWEYRHFDERLEFINDDSECPPTRFPPGPYSLKPNTPTICTTIHEVAQDAKNIALLATDLEGYEAGLIILSDAKTADPAPTAVPPGTYEVGKGIAPGVYRGEASEDSFCKWARLSDLKEDPESIIAMDLHEGPFYVEVQTDDKAFTTECKLMPIAHLEPRDPLLTSLAPGMYRVGLDIGPGQYKGEPQEDLFCFWQRLSNFRGEDESTIEWDLPGEEYVVDVALSDYAVEFDCPVVKVATSGPTSTQNPTPEVKVPKGWQRIGDERLGYSLAVPEGWNIIDLQRIEQYWLWSIFSTLAPDASEGLRDVLNSPEGENLGYLAVELDRFPKPSIKSMALVATAPLDDGMPTDIVIQLLRSVIESFDMFPVDVQSIQAGTTNNLSSIQGVASADLSSQGLYAAHAVITALRANDTAYILVVVTSAKDAEAKQQQIDQIVGTFRPE